MIDNLLINFQALVPADSPSCVATKELCLLPMPRSGWMNAIRIGVNGSAEGDVCPDEAIML